MRRKLTEIKNRLMTRLTELTGSSTIVRTFDFMKIAEEEIKTSVEAAENLNNQDAARRIRKCFMACQPGPFIRYTDRVYRAHVKELLARALVGESLEAATKAEVMLTLAEGSLVAPLNQQHGALYEELFKDVFGHYVSPDDVRDIRREPYEGASSELLRTLRQRCRKEGRCWS